VGTDLVQISSKAFPEGMLIQIHMRAKGDIDGGSRFDEDGDGAKVGAIALQTH
jgi:hypothetical protein